MLKKVSCLLIACLMLLGICTSTATFTAEAATTSNSYIVNVYDGGRNYKGKYEIYHDFGTYKGSLTGKKFTIEAINYCSVLPKSDVSYFNTYARFSVYLYKDGYLYKYYDRLKNGASFKLPSGSYKIVIRSEIDSSGWSQFGAHTGLWTYAQYRLKY